MKRFLLLDDGTLFTGKALGAKLTSELMGEVVFTTSMTGYQETITDQSFNGQIITFTYPMIGNYGINRDDYESIKPTCKGIIVKEHARLVTNWRTQMTLNAFLTQKGIVGIAGIDTRALTRKLRLTGTMQGIITDTDHDLVFHLNQLKANASRKDQVAQVSTRDVYSAPNSGKNVVVIDFGLKHSILRELSRRHCNLTILPYDTSAEAILELQPDGVVLTNGPGDPNDVKSAIQTIQKIQSKVPIFGICLGHQLFALANGAATYKMSFGHRGLNHPVRDLATGKISFTSQNHGYSVDKTTIDTEQLIITHIEINDGTIEGLKHRYYPAFTVQYHPEAAPGPHDGRDLFDKFMLLMDSWKEQQ